MPQTLHVAIFNTDIPVPNVATTRGSSYGQIFHNLLTAATSRISPSATIRSTEYDSRKEEYPASLSDVDLVLITGSIHSAYEKLPWVHKLSSYLVDSYVAHPHVKWFGSCFGHQILCQALLAPYGVRVLADERGWELGVQSVRMNRNFQRAFEQCESDGFRVKDQMRLQFVHGDFVDVPEVERLPASWSVIGSTEWCANQGMYEPGRVLTFQGHFEFDRFVNSETIKTFFARKAPEWLEESLRAVDADDDAEEVADMVLRFMMQKSPAKPKTHGVLGGLATPPEEEV